MKLVKIMVIALALSTELMSTPTFPANPFKTETSEAAIRYVSGYTRSNGQSVRGHYRDTSNDGNKYNNANYLGYNN